ncbi:hypothetical protein [Reyranella sp.]|uniref:hypothetical protein n=1 Tax=Reyranella sp. TaxID=1929291 RepID=UPI00271D1E93|nr:hypothetical protein [Reyranella sp.]MDO8977542.1 hypothetical protein [Reyranella sp.]
MRKRLAEGSPELRPAYVRLLLENATVDHNSILLEGSPVILEMLASRGSRPPSSRAAPMLPAGFEVSNQ